MSANIMTKIVLTVVGVLVLVQILIYNGTQVNNLAESQAERVRLSREIEELAATKEEMLHYLAGLQHEYSEIAASVPEKILHGYEDHEEMLAGFLDYIKAAEISSVEATVSLQGGRKYINKPVPLFEHDMAFDFTFTRLSDAQKFLAFILDQDHYPLVVRNLELRTGSGRQISGTLLTSLLIPARQQHPLFGMKEKED